MNKEWIIVANGTKVKILKKQNNSLEHVFPTYHKDELTSNFDKDAKKPGKTRQGFGGKGSVYSPHIDLHEHEKIEFLQE